MIVKTVNRAEPTASWRRPKMGLEVDFPGEAVEIHEGEDEWTLSPKMKVGWRNGEMYKINTTKRLTSD